MNKNSSTDILFMQRALSLASQRKGFCAPNPAVGAVVVKDNRVIGEGHHLAFGCEHAEVSALKGLGVEANGATLYVTLEPCCHHGKTPPCTDLLIQHRLARVVYGIEDPNPIVASRGAQLLNQAGIICEQIEVAEVKQFYQSYQYWWGKRYPLVTVKLALSLDGKIADPLGNPVMMSGGSCNKLTHQQRYTSDAILTSVQTILADDPRLNARIDGVEYKKPIYILDRRLRLPITAQIFQTAAQITLFHNSNDEQRQRQLINLGVSCIRMPEVASGLDLDQILSWIGQQGRHDLWIEAGGQCFSAFIQQGLAQRALLYLSTKILGPEAKPAFIQSFDLLKLARSHHWQAYGNDVVLELNF